MSRSYEHFRELDGDSIDWEARNEYDRMVQDGLDAEPPTESRFETPKWFVPVIPYVERSDEYNAMDTFTKEDWDSWYERHQR